MADDETFGAPVVANDPLAGTAYQTLAFLGRGAMAEVVEAEHLPLGRRVVVKLLHEAHADDPRVVDRLRVEARSLALVRHPNVVAVTDFGRTADGRPFLVTERLVGRTVGAELRARGGGYLPVGEAVAIVVQVLAGLEAAHQKGIIHRDVKPENLFLCDGEPGVGRIAKVLDFGVAKIIGEHSRRHTAPEYATKEGTFVGTPRFLAPEQIRGGSIDARTDVYGAALVLYTLLAGRGPFAHHRESLEIVKAHLFEPPAPPSRYARQPIPAELDRAILKALAKNSDERFASAASFAAELSCFATEHSGAAPVVQQDDGETLESETFVIAAPAPPERVAQESVRVERRGGGLSPRSLVLVALGSSVVFFGLIVLAMRLVR